MRRINAFMEAEPAIQAPDELAKGLEPSTKSGLKFNRVSFTYPETGIEAVKNLSFQLIPGKILAVTGRTGSGKSTVAQLAMRIFDPHEGQVVFDGIPLQQWPLNEFRSETGYVPQDVFLFSDTIQRNIAFGLPEEDSTRREVQSAAEQAHVAHNIEGFEQEYETLLGERGVNLSGGQKQRISIARALIRKPKLLILDDCLSAVDTETEEAILQSIRNQGDSTAVLMVSHRISSIRGADHVVVLDQGKLIEEGTPEELAQADGVYARMVQQQVNRNNTSA